MQFPVVQLLLKKDVYTTTPMRVLPQDVALLTVMHGKGNVIEPQATGESRERDPAMEYERLARTYRKDQKGVPWVEVAFGKEHEARLEQVMKDGIKHFGPKKKRASRKKKVQDHDDTQPALHGSPAQPAPDESRPDA